MPIETSFESVTLIGTLKKSGYHKVFLDGHITGNFELNCDRCGKTYDLSVDNALNLKLSDIISDSKDDLDIIEFLNGEIDVDYILESEINTLRSEYNYCEKCNNDGVEFEVEY